VKWEASAEVEVRAAKGASRTGQPRGTPEDGAKLRAFRGEYAQEDLAERCGGVSLTTVQRGERAGRYDDTF
jgi:hypothetical protein